MLKVREGNLEHLGLLFERYKKVLFGFFYNQNHNQDLSEDLVQTVFERILRYRKGFKGDGEFKVWMFHIARNVNIDHYRKNKRFQKEDIDEWGDRLGDGTGNSEEAIKKAEELKMLQMAIGRLDLEKREVIMFSKIDGLKYAQIGKILNCTEGAVKVKVFRAMKALRSEFLKIEKAI